MLNLPLNMPAEKLRTLETVTKALQDVPNVAAIVLGGSRARGLARPDSDIDVGIYYREASPFRVDRVRSVAETICTAESVPIVTGMYEWSHGRHAISLYERVLEINPTNWSAMWLIGNVRLLSPEPVVVTQPQCTRVEEPTLLCNQVHQRFGEFPEALTWFERSHQTNPSHPDVVREAALCAMEIGSTDKAIEYSQRAALVKPGDAGLRANLALAYLLGGRIADAQKSVDEAQAAEPADKISQTIRSMIGHFAANGRVPRQPNREVIWPVGLFSNY